MQISCLFTYYTTPPLSALLTEPSGCHEPIFKQQYVAAKVVLHQPNKLSTSCCHVATSERRHIQSKADTRFFALREASIRRSQRGNNSATSQTLSTTLRLRLCPLTIVRGNCEAFCVRGGTIPWLPNTIASTNLSTQPHTVVLW